jgi:CO/xanthine dehydrogenase FAD-binding subunit
MKPFELHEPKTAGEACRLLQELGSKGKALAGGTDLLVLLKQGRLKISHVVNLKRIGGLDKLTFHEKKGLSIGALVTWAQLMEFDPVNKRYPLLQKAAESMGSQQIRNVATLVGNICHASPAANGAIPLLLYGATCNVRGMKENRVLPIDKLFGGAQKNRLKREEILTTIQVPPPLPDAKGTFIKYALRKAMDLGTVNVGVLVGLDNGRFGDVGIALGAVAPKPFRARRAERVLKGQGISDEVIRKAAETAAQECSPITDVRASKEYRLEMVKELTFRAIRDCVTAAG